ncbi:MAG: hypothetical protein Q9213_006358 [Squamulea squamosa]
MLSCTPDLGSQLSVGRDATDSARGESINQQLQAFYAPTVIPQLDRSAQLSYMSYDLYHHPDRYQLLSPATTYSPEHHLLGLGAYGSPTKAPPYQGSQPLVVPDKLSTSRSTSSVIKQEPNIDQSLIARERILKEAAIAARQHSASHQRRGETRVVQQHKQSIPRLTPTLGSTAHLTLRGVEDTLASLNKQISNANVTHDTDKRERLAHEKERVLRVWRQLSAEHLRKKHGGVEISANAAHFTGRYVPSDSNAGMSDGTARTGNSSNPIDSYRPVDRYRPQYQMPVVADIAKRLREPSPEEEMEVMAEVITQVNRLTKRVAGLQDGPGPQKKRKGAAEGLAVALRASVEELLAKTKEVTK